MSQQQAKPASQQKEDIDLVRLFAVLIDHKWLIIIITFLAAVVGLAYALLATPIFRANALVQIEQASPMNPLADVNSLLGKAPPSQAEVEIIRSRMVLGRTVDILNLDLIVVPARLPVVGAFLNRMGVERPGFANDWSSIWANESIVVKAMPVTDAFRGETFTLRVSDALQYALYYEDEKIADGRVGEPLEVFSGDVGLTLEALNAPPGAEFMLTRIPRLLAIADLRDNLRISERGQETGILDWGYTHAEPDAAQTTLRTIADIYVAQNIQRQSEEARKSLEFLNQQLPTVHAELRTAEDLLNAYRSGRESVDLSLETRSVLERLVNIESQLNELSFSEAEISRRFTSDHPTYSALLEKKDQLQAERTSIERKINDLPETQQEILRLQRDVSVTQEIYVQLRNKAQEMQIAEASTVGNVRVLDSAEVYPRPVAPRKKIILVFTTVLGGLIAVGIVLLRAMLRRGVETQEQIESLGLPVYATVPLSGDQQKLSRRIKSSRKRLSTAPAGLLALCNPADTSIEALRGLRTSLHFGMAAEDNNRIMVTGPSPATGKSFVSANLAAVCAQMGQRVLVIDGDMRKGHLHQVFGDKSEGGLSELLVERYTLNEVIRPVTSIENMHYISRGSAPPNPSELLASPKFTSLLKAVSPDYDLVIIDSPPIMAVTDAAIIGRQVDTTLMVARFQLNPPKEIELALQRLETGGVKVKGAILNAIERTAATAYGYGYYNYSYK